MDSHKPNNQNPKSISPLSLELCLCQPSLCNHSHWGEDDIPIRRSRKTRIIKSDYLPKELVMEILLRLPIKSVVKFRCVCKSWCILLSDPNFIHKNLLFDCGDGDINKYSHLLVKRYDKTTKPNVLRNVFSVLSYDTLDEISSIEPLPNPSGVYDRSIDITILGSSCNGVFCLDSGGGFVLWNPATRETKVVPEFHFRCPFNASSNYGHVGFGFDSKTNDYKVVKLLKVWYYRDGYDGVLGRRRREVETTRVEAGIYSLRNDSWKTVDSIVQVSSFCIQPYCQVTTSGAYHWRARGKNATDLVIVSLDLSNETFKITPQPNDLIISPYSGIKPTVLLDGSINILLDYDRSIFRLNESIAMLTYCNKIGEIERPFHLWVLLEVGVKESWTKLFTITLITGVKRPVGLWRNGELFLETNSGELLVFDPTTHEITKVVQLDGILSTLQIIPYMESRISLKEGNEDIKEDNFLEVI